MKTRKQTYQPWTETVESLFKTGKFSRRQIAKITGVPRSTCLDYIRKIAG